ncbi:MAG: hypothetical protein AAF202_01745 [Pseudomonadota bacterium]
MAIVVVVDVVVVVGGGHGFASIDTFALAAGAVIAFNMKKQSTTRQRAHTKIKQPAF